MYKTMRRGLLVVFLTVFAVARGSGDTIVDSVNASTTPTAGAE